VTCIVKFYMTKFIIFFLTFIFTILILKKLAINYNLWAELSLTILKNSDSILILLDIVNNSHFSIPDFDYYYQLIPLVLYFLHLDLKYLLYFLHYATRILLIHYTAFMFLTTLCRIVFLILSLIYQYIHDFISHKVVKFVFLSHLNIATSKIKVNLS